MLTIGVVVRPPTQAATNNCLCNFIYRINVRNINYIVSLHKDKRGNSNRNKTCKILRCFSTEMREAAGTTDSLHGNKTHTWWRHHMETFSVLLAICAGNSPVNSPHKDQWRGALMFSLICVWINGWVNNREAGDLRRYHAHYDVTVMKHKTHLSTHRNERQRKLQCLFTKINEVAESTVQFRRINKTMETSTSLHQDKICTMPLQRKNIIR